MAEKKGNKKNKAEVENLDKENENKVDQKVAVEPTVNENADVNIDNAQSTSSVDTKSVAKKSKSVAGKKAKSADNTQLLEESQSQNVDDTKNDSEKQIADAAQDVEAQTTDKTQVVDNAQNLDVNSNVDINIDNNDIQNVQDANNLYMGDGVYPQQFTEFGEMQGDIQQDFIQENYIQEIPQQEIKSKKNKKVKVIKRVNVEKNLKAISRQKRNKIIGKILACVFVLAFIGTLVGITAFSYKAVDKIWWENVGEEAGVEFKELFTLFNGVTDADEDKIVTKGYTSADLDAFYENLKRKMFLAQDYDLSISQIIASVMSATGENGENNNNGEVQTRLSYTTIGVDGYDLQYVYMDENGDTIVSDVPPTSDDSDIPSDGSGNENGENSSLTGNEQLDNLLKEIKFDFSSLEQYEGEDNILEISDKQLGAVVNDAFTALSSAFGDLEELEQKIGKSINEVLAVKQIIIDGDELSDEDVNLKMTLEVRAKDLLSNLLKEYGIPSIVNLILPEKLYASVRVYPYNATKSIEASINRLEETKVNKIVRIIDVILKKTGNTNSISDMLVQVNSKVVEVIDQAGQKLPIRFVATGSVDLYPIESLMGMLDVDVSEQAFLYMLKDIKLPTGESLGLTMPTPEYINQQTNIFVTELSEKYCLDNSDGKISNDNTIKDVMNFASSDTALEAINLNEMDYSGSYSQQLKVRTSYDALAGMLSDYVKNEGLLGDISADIVKMSYTSLSETLAIDIRINLSQMLGFDDNSVMSSLIKQLVPEYIYVSANICVNASKNIPTSIEINKTGVDKSLKHLDTLTALAGKFGMDTSSLTYDKICEQIDSGMKEGLAQMQEKIGCEILFTTECAYLPNLFEVVCGTGLLDESEEHKIEPQNLYSIMKQAYTYEVASTDQNKSKNAKGFIGELEGKYYLQQGKIVDNGDGMLLQSVMGLKDTFGTSIDKDALADDKRSMGEIYPQMTAGEFAYLMELNIDTENMSETLKSAEMLGAKINDDTIELYLKAQLYEQNSDIQTRENIDVDTPQDEEDLSKYSNLLPQYAYVTLIIDTIKMTTDSQENAVKVIIDGMEDDNMSDFFSIVRKLTGKSVTESEIEQKVDVQVKEYMGGVKGIEYKFVDGMMLLDNIFNVIANSNMVKSEDPSQHVFESQEIRRLLQKLYGFDYSAIGGEFTPSTNLDHFIDVELYDKYFISDSFKDRLKEYERQDALLDGFAGIGGGNFSVDNIRIKDIVRDNGTIYGLTSLHNLTDRTGKSQSQIENEVAQNFKPKFTSEDLAYLLRTHVSSAGDMSFLQDQEVVYADNDENIMTLTLRGKDNLQDENAKGLMPEYLYINVTIELGTIKSDGTRDDMNVYSLDINSVGYVEGSGEDQDLPLLLMLVDRLQKNTQDNTTEPEEVSLDGIMQDIEENLKEFKKQIHNNVFTITFLAEGGLMFNETVYQIALNSVYEVPATDYEAQGQMPDEIDFRNGICKVNNMPDKYEYTQNVFLDLANGNRAENSSHAIAEINDKYALSKPLQDGSLAILTILGEYAKDYATSIDGQKLTSPQKRAMTFEELRPSIDGEELLLMLEDSVTFTADGYQNAVLNALYIRNDEMIIVYNTAVDIDEQSQKYKDLLPDLMSIIVGIDVNTIDNPDVICTQIGVNDLLRSEVDAIQSLMLKLNQKEGVESKSLDEANKDCSDNVRATMKSLTDNMKVRYVADNTIDEVTGGGVMILDSIYEVSAQKINDIDKENDKVYPKEVKETLEALFDGLNIQAYTPPAGVSSDKITYTTDSSAERSSNLYLNVANRNISGAIGGWNIASMIDTNRLLEPLGFDASAPNSGDILKLKHTALVPKKENGDGTFDEIREKLGSLLDKEYFLITLDLDMVAAAGVKMSILPERMDMTLYMDLTSEEISIIYNAMSDRQRSILSRLVKTSRPEGVGGLDLSNTEAVKSEIMDMKIIDEPMFSITLKQLLKSDGAVVPISRVAEYGIIRDDNIILGMGAKIINYSL